MKTFIILYILFYACAAFGQELPAFELLWGIDLEQVGITPVFLDRWGIISADIDGNGWPDLLEKKWRGVEHSQIYMNTNGIFQEISGGSPELIQVEGDQQWTRSPVFADYDNDGDKDLFWGSNDNFYLFENENSVFKNISQQVGLKAIKPPGFITWWNIDIGAWADYDLDGDLDLIISQVNNPNYYFYRNDAGVFTNIAADVGLTGLSPLGHVGDYGYAYGRLQWVDYDFDGDPDFSSGPLLFRNDDGIFSEVSQELGLDLTDPITIFSDWFDYDNDGDLDYLKLSTGASAPNELWSYENGIFIDVSNETGIGMSASSTGGQVGLSIGDYDNDGDQDIFINVNNEDEGIDVLLLNEEIEPGVHAFADVGPYIGFGSADRMGSTVADFNMDGFLDIFLASAEKGAMYYRNLGNENHWVGFILKGIESNADAIGTRVTVVSEGQRRIRHTRIPTSWNTQDHPFVHFGLGTATTIDSVIIKWPLGLNEVLKNVQIDQYHTIIEGQATSVQELKPIATRPETWLLSQNYPNPFNPSTTIIYGLAEAGHVRLDVYSMSGAHVAMLVDEYQSVGLHSLVFNTTDLAAGIYLYRIKSGNFSQQKKMVLIK